MGRFSRNRLQVDRLVQPAPRAPATPEEQLRLTARDRLGAPEALSALDLHAGSPDDYRGRPTLSMELAPIIAARAVGQSKVGAQIILRAMRVLWRALDDIEARTQEALDRLADLARGHGQLVKSFVLEATTEKQAPLIMATINSVVFDARQAAGLPPLSWPVIERAKTPVVHDTVDPNAVRILRSICVRTLTEVDERIARRGDDHHDGVLPVRGLDRFGHVRWNWPGGPSRANLSRLARLHVAQRAMGRRTPELYAASFNPWARAAKETDTNFTELAELFLPSREEAVAAYLLVCLSTGWIDATPEIDITRPWFIDITPDKEGQPDGRGMVGLMSIRAKNGGAASARSLKGAKFGAYRVIERQIRRTAFARQLIRHALRPAMRDAAATSSPAITKRIHRLRKMSRSPWLYRGSSSTYIGLITGAGDAYDSLGAMIDGYIERFPDRDDPESIAALRRLNISDLRDAHADKVYAETGGNIFEVQAELGHRNVASTISYLRQRHQIAERFEKFRTATGIMLDEVSNGFAVDPAILRLRVADGFDEEQRRRLYENRTTMQMGCLAPTAPPRELAPNHTNGTLCAVQRCTICRHGIFFPDAPRARDALIRRHAELRRIRAEMNPDRFVESSLFVEIKTIEAMRDAFYASSATAFDEESDRLLAARIGDPA